MTLGRGMGRVLGVATASTLLLAVAAGCAGRARTGPGPGAGEGPIGGPGSSFLIEDLAIPIAGKSGALAINSGGQVVGHAYTEGAAIGIGIRWSGGKAHPLAVPSGVGSVAYGIDDLG